MFCFLGALGSTLLRILFDKLDILAQMFAAMLPRQELNNYYFIMKMLYTTEGHSRLAISPSKTTIDLDSFGTVSLFRK